MKERTSAISAGVSGETGFRKSSLMQWPCKISLVPTRAPYFNGADLLIAADCAAYACRSLHEELMRDRITLIGCALSDPSGLHERLTAIIRENDVRSITVARLEVGCCGGIELAVRRALVASGKELPLFTVTISTNGRITDNTI